MNLDVQRGGIGLKAETVAWRDLVAHSADAIWVLDRDDRIIAWNRAAEELFGYTREEILGQPLSLLVPPDLQESSEPERLRKALEELGAVRDYLTRRVTKSGKVLEIALTRTVHEGGPHQGPVSAAIVRDFTQRRAIERQMIEVEKLAAVGELSASVAQEIGAPLTTIGLVLDTLKRSDSPCREHGKELERIDRAMKRIGTLARGLVELAKPGALHLAPVSPKDVLDGALELAASSLRRGGVELEVDCPAELPTIKADAGQLQQVFLHLLMNAQGAFRKQGRGGKLRIKATVGDALPSVGQPVRRALLLEFEDNGPGIDAADLPFIFTPFFSRSGGSGLGLPLARRIVHAHGGALQVHSEPGVGTRVTVNLPVDTDE